MEFITRNRRTTQSSLGDQRQRKERGRPGDLFLCHGGGTNSFDRDLQERHQRRFECRREKGSEETQRKLVGGTMDKKLFADLVESMQQHNEIIAGTRKPARVTRVDAQSIKVLRAKAGLTQEKFAALIQVDLSTLRNWEQGRREPTGPAKALIRAITNDPKHVLKALEVGATIRKAG
jgi:putative transcriptional regulator